MEQDLRDEGAARSAHVVHVLPSDDHRIDAIVRAQVERIAVSDTEGPTLRTLVLVGSEVAATHLAGAVNDGLDASGALLIPVADRARAPRRLAAGALAAVTTPGIARELLRQSALKLDAVDTVVLVDLDRLVALYLTDLDDLLAELPKGADRIATAADLGADVEAFLERHARRARRMQYDGPVSSAATLHYVVADRSGRDAVLARLLDSLDPEHATVVAAEEDAEAACSALAHLGYGPDDAMVAFSDGDVPEGEGLVVLYTAPTEASDLATILETEPGHVVALVAPDELTAFLRVFGQSVTASLPQAKVVRAASAMHTLREAIRHVLDSHSLHHELLALAPVFDERDPAEVAAALLVLLERAAAAPGRTPSHAEPATAAAPAQRTDRERTERAAPRSREREPRSAPVAAGNFTPVYVNVGVRDGAKKGDLVGALANEGGISAELLGRITMRDTFSVVEVDASVAEQVIEGITGKTIRGRVVNARVDRRPEDRPARRDDRRPSDRPARHMPGARGPRDDAPRSRGRGGFGDRPRGGPRRDAGDRPRRPRGGDDAGPRTFREERPARGPRAIGESREWGERGERLRNARRPRRGND
ncbi:MAG: DbpA RNA binding domain-containing protein [Gemmatimonadaceae bacterium]|nr:DbpA RNA binding domain-containing protein [Gemmatimonadaceae bacterium]